MKSTFLKVMGILLIIFGAIGLVSDLASIGTYMYLGLSPAILILSIVDCVVELVAGILGIMSSNDQRKAAGCIVWGALMIIIIIILFIVEGATGYFTLLSWAGMGSTVVMSVIFSLICPVLYFLAAFLFVRKRY